MRPLLYLGTFATLMALAFWAYRENYATQAALKNMSVLQAEIADLREALSLQNAEWAYLNRPDRLRELATINFDRLGLLPMEPAQFGAAAEVALPQAEMLLVTGAVDVMGLAGGNDPDSDGVFP